jgi:hypothetical protein
VTGPVAFRQWIGQHADGMWRPCRAQGRQGTCKPTAAPLRSRAFHKPVCSTPSPTMPKTPYERHVRGSPTEAGNVFIQCCTGPPYSKTPAASPKAGRNARAPAPGAGLAAGTADRRVADFLPRCLIAAGFLILLCGTADSRRVQDLILAMIV